MKKLMIAFAMMLVGMTSAQAQYQDLIDLKITQLVQIQQQVMVSSLEAEDKDQALDTLAENLATLTSHRDEIDLTKLQTLETEINAINGQLAAKILSAKKVRMQQKLDKLAQVIEAQKESGKNTAALEGLWSEMNQALQNL